MENSSHRGIGLSVKYKKRVCPWQDGSCGLSTLIQYSGENSVAISYIFCKFGGPWSEARGGGSIPNDSLAWTGCKHKSNLFHWHRKERSPLPSSSFLFFSPTLPPHPALPLSSCSSHFPPSVHPTLHPCMPALLPLLLLLWPQCDGFVLLLRSVWQGNPRLEWGRGPTPSEHWGVALWMPK